MNLKFFLINYYYSFLLLIMSRIEIEQCHSSMLSSIHTKGDDRCSPIFPYPKEYKLPHMKEPVSIPTIFRFGNYEEKLKSVRCSAVYSQYTTLALNEAMQSGAVVKPKFMIAPMKTSITFFNKEHATPFSITKKEYDNIQEHSSKLPSYFNWMEANTHINRPFNQGLCGSCWAVAVATCLSDVFVASKKTETNPNLSPTYILSCMPQSQCDGGDPSQAVFDVSKNGISSAGCLDYSWCTESACSGDPLKHFGSKNINQYIPECKCSVNTTAQNLTKYFVGESLSICIPPKLDNFSIQEQSEIKYFMDNMYGNVESTHLDLSAQSNKSIQQLIKYHIYTFGPVIGGFHVFKNFFKGNYRETNDIYVETASYSGVEGLDYSDLERDWVGSHAVVIVGWGVDTIHDETVDYWVVRNSWGTEWGNRGTFKMAMYGNDPNKRYQNRASQFEYPSIIKTQGGIGITGGMLIMKAGEIKSGALSTPEGGRQEPVPAPVPGPVESHKKPKDKELIYSMLAFVLFIAFFVVLYYIFKQRRKEQWIIIAETILLIILFSVLIGMLPKSKD